MKKYNARPVVDPGFPVSGCQPHWMVGGVPMSDASASAKTCKNERIGSYLGEGCPLRSATADRSPDIRFVFPRFSGDAGVPNSSDTTDWMGSLTEEGIKS